MWPFQKSRISLLLVLPMVTMSCTSQRWSSQDYTGPPTVLENGVAYAPPQAPPLVQRAVQAGNELQGVGYQYGGGHGGPSTGIDCSGMVSHVLRSCGLLSGALASKGFRRYGAAGPGKWITIYAKNGHAFMTIGGLRLDTGNQNADGGPRWTTQPRLVGEFDARHPDGW
jgi:hypothetical protein